MKYIYIVYKEENLSVFESQVLCFLKKLKEDFNKDVMLIVIKNKSTNEHEVSNKIENYLGLDYKILDDISPLKYFSWKKNVVKFLANNKRNDYSEEIIIHARSSKAAILGNEVKRYYQNSKLIFDNRGVPIEEIDMMIKYEKSVSKRIKLRLSKVFFRYCIEQAKSKSDMYTFVTNNLRNHMISKYNYDSNKEYLIIPTCIEFSRNIEKSELKRNINRFIYVGSNDCWQNSNDVMKLFKYLEEKNYENEFVILSKDNEKFKVLNEKMRIKNIKFECTNHEGVIKYLKSSGYGIILRDDSIVNSVSSPTKLIEYLALGVNVIYSGNIGVIDDIVGKYGVNVMKKLIPVEDIYNNEFTDIEGIYTASEYTEYFSWDINIKKILNKL